MGERAGDRAALGKRGEAPEEVRVEAQGSIGGLAAGEGEAVAPGPEAVELLPADLLNLYRVAMVAMGPPRSSVFRPSWKVCASLQEVRRLLRKCGKLPS